MNNGDQKQFVDFDGVKLKVFEDDDVAGVLAAVRKIRKMPHKK